MVLPELFLTLLARLEAELTTLPDKPEETPATTLRALWSFVAGTPRSAEAAASAALDPLNAGQVAELEHLVEARLSGIPLAHITGRQGFMGLELIAGPEALVPRKETELLGRTALEHLPAGLHATVIDLCTGSGNLAAAMATAVPSVVVHAADLSADAVHLARRNMEFVGVGDRVGLYVGDLFEALPPELAGTADLVLCNPPYISSARVGDMVREISAYEPRLAFDGGNFGLAIVGRLLAEAPMWLRSGGWLCFEIGKGQGAHWMRKLSQQPAYDLLDAAVDAEGDIRVIAARRL